MKNITLSLPDDLLRKSRAYAKNHNTSLNQLVRDLLAKVVESKSTIDKLLDASKSYKKVHKDFDWNRKDLYDRQILH